MRPHVGLEAVIVLVLLAADAAFIGPWKRAGRTGKPPCHHEAQDQVSLGREDPLADKGAMRTNREGIELGFTELSFTPTCNHLCSPASRSCTHTLRGKRGP